jgi:hypothetical protein
MAAMPHTIPFFGCVSQSNRSPESRPAIQVPWKGIVMKLNHTLSLAMVLALAPGFALAMPQDGAGSGQESNDAIQTSHAALPINIEPAVATQQEQSKVSPHEQFKNCHQLAFKTREHARSIAKTATGNVFRNEVAVQQHKQLQESLGALRQEHEQLVQSLSEEQRSSVQMRNASLLQAHDRMQNLVSEMERELNGSVLHTKDVADQARATDREMKAFQKEFQAMGKDLGFSIN